MLFTGVNRGKPVSSIGFYSRSRRMGNRGSGNANRTEAGITHRENLKRAEESTEGRSRTTDKLWTNVLLKKVPELAPIFGQAKLTPD